MLRGKGLRGKFHFTRWGVIVLALVLSLGMLGVNFAIQSGSVRAEQTKIHTSGSQPIEPGMTFGDFTVVEVETDRGKVTFLTLQYDGDEATYIEVKAGKYVLFEGGVDPNEAFSFNGTANDGELGKEVKITVNKGGGGGGGGGAWWAGLLKGHPIETVECSDPFTWVVSNDDGSTDNISPYGTIDPGDDGLDPCQPQTMGMKLQAEGRYDKDVAKTEAVKIDDFNIEVTVTNAYPSYHPTVFFALECPESVSGVIQDIVIDEIDDDTSDPEPDIIPELTVTYSGIYIGQPIPAGGEVAGALHIHVEQCAEQGGATYEIRLSITTVCGEVEEKCGTAYAYGGDDYAICFIGMTDLKNPPWGWTNGELGPGSYEFDMYAGASHCDISGGELVGTLTIVYNGSTAIVTYNMNPGFVMDVTHLYVGNEPLPRDKKGNYTVNPGQYPYSNVPVDPTTDRYEISISGDYIYVIAHAVTCWSPE